MVHLPRCCNTDKKAKGRVTFRKLPENENRKKRWLVKTKREGKFEARELFCLLQPCYRQ